MREKILLIEDNKEVSILVREVLSSIAEVDWAGDIQTAKKLLEDNDPYSLILLDIELPDGNGLSFCSHLQAMEISAPIFFLTAHSELSEKVLGFTAGAEDYITKPFEPLELKARVESKLRRIQMMKENASLLKWPSIEIDKDKQEVHLQNDGQWQKADLTSLEFKLLIYMANRPQQVVSRDSMLNDIWGENIHVYSRSVDTHVSKLRKKLGPAAHLIESVHGTGYKFMPA